jgi:hypothetical protein
MSDCVQAKQLLAEAANCDSAMIPDDVRLGRLSAGIVLHTCASCLPSNRRSGASSTRMKPFGSRAWRMLPRCSRPRRDRKRLALILP